MNWLALRLLRPYLIVVAGLSAVSATFVLIGALAIGRQVDAHGMTVEGYAPDRTGLCESAAGCLPAGAANSLAQAIALVAAFAPVLIGLILGVPLFAREREESTDTFALTQSVTRRRWLTTKFSWAVAAAVIGTAAVAVVFRVTAARYTLVLDDPRFALLREIHKNSIAFMVMQAVFITVLAGVIGLVSGRTLRTVVLSALAWPAMLVVAQIGGLILAMSALLLTSWSETLSQMFGTLGEDETAMFAALALAGYTVVALLIGGRATRRT
ncbi:hypothetical protein Q0Z83_043810 [Actinoplanes sichuanensis]|uniref:ABC transporter permease n=1 Tax=Actinoplanes sichuanensis TaxID=512349 RepID=A0ABW4AW01_9ACTN|nr:hypothetical protein [Actinoplanes sichuanensis]BEL06190.1 hypothetical protein Q0Z83_043810 [Actinoplanes sichuanensis]